jgi:hypothetical protein
MTTKIYDIHDAIITGLSTELTGYARMANPYNVGDNPDIILKKSYGLAIGEGTNTKRYVGCLATWQRDYRILITQQVVNTANAVTGKAETAKQIIDAHRLVYLYFEANPNLGGTCIKAEIEGDTGIDPFENETSKYLALTINLSVEYQEPS